MVSPRPSRQICTKLAQRKEFEAASEQVAAGKGDLTDQKQRITEAEAIEQAKQGRRSSFRSPVSPAQAACVLAMFAHGFQSRPGRRSGPGSISSALSQDRNLSRRIRLLHLASSDDGQRRADATPQEGFAGGIARRNARSRRRGAAERVWHQGCEADRLGRSPAVAASHRPVAAGLSNRYLCCTTWKDSNTTKLPRWWGARLAIASRSCIRPD